MKASHTSKWAGVGHKRKMELKAEERRKRKGSRPLPVTTRTRAEHMLKQLKLQQLWSTSKPEAEHSHDQ